MFENYRVFRTELAGRPLVIETGKTAGLANGACLVRYGDTVVHCAVTMSEKPRDGIDFFPLRWTLRKSSIPWARSPALSSREKAVRPTRRFSTSRLIDRPIRPLFPKDMRNDVSVVATVMSVDPDCSPEITAMIGVSTAITISDIPWNGPISGVSVGYVDEEYVINPTAEQREKSRMAVTVASTDKKVAMIEAGANQIPEDVMLEGILNGHETNQNIVQFIRTYGPNRQAEGGVPSLEPDPEMLEAVKAYAIEDVKAALDTDDKTVRDERLKPMYDGGARKVRRAVPRPGGRHRRVPLPHPEIRGAPLASGRAKAGGRPRHGRNPSLSGGGGSAAPGTRFGYVYPRPDPGAHRGDFGSGQRSADARRHRSPGIQALYASL